MSDVPPHLKHPHPDVPHVPVPSPERVAEIAALLPAEPTWPLGDLTDRDRWARRAAHPELASILPDAEAALAIAPPPLTPELYERYWHDGHTKAWDTAANPRATRLRRLALGEAFENRGRFAPALQETIALLCDQWTWVNPYHDFSRTNLTGERLTIDLISAMTGASLAAAAAILGDRLDPDLRARVTKTLEDKIFSLLRPAYTTGEHGPWWLDADHNWNAVCLCGSTVAALATLPDREDRARFVAGAELHIARFLHGFGPDGVCEEGILYWNYGFAHFAFLAEALHSATGGAVDLWSRPTVPLIAAFPARTQMRPRLYPSFSDTRVDMQPDPWTVAIGSRRCGFGFGEAERAATGNIGWIDYQLYTAVAVLLDPHQELPPSDGDTPVPPHDWFPHSALYIGRPGPHSPSPLTVAFKGGHNGVPHNHNDLGSFIIAVGDVLVATDPGREEYHADSFSERRYESPINNSHGHSVPKIDGRLQSPGEAFAAAVIATSFSGEEDQITLELAGAYELPHLRSLTRTFTYSRAGSGSVLVEDHLRSDQPASYETALITFEPWATPRPGTLILGTGDHRLHVTWEPALPVELGSEVLKVRLDGRSSHPTRLSFRLPAATEVTFRLQFTPEA